MELTTLNKTTAELQKVLKLSGLVADKADASKLMDNFAHMSPQALEGLITKLVIILADKASK